VGFDTKPTYEKRVLVNRELRDDVGSAAFVLPGECKQAPNQHRHRAAMTSIVANMSKRGLNEHMKHILELL
jgi:hypothetical protein